MADSTCGPSNAFKGLARHIEQDRSHQQDRVAPGPQHPAQNFRSAPFNSGLAAQFGAFQQHNAALPQQPSAGWELNSRPVTVEPHPAHPAQAPSFLPQRSTLQPPSFTPSAGGNWVNDFQRMNFADPHRSLLLAQPVHGPIMGNIHVADPLRPGFPRRMLEQQPAFQPFQTGFDPAGMLQANNSILGPEFIDNASLATDAQTEAILEREFQDAMDQWMRENGDEAETSAPNELNVRDGDNLSASLDPSSADSTTNDTPEKDSVENRDELARAAQQLVDSLAENNSEKFKNSDFLALMRRIATQQLTVQGNDLVETQPGGTEAGSSSHATDTEPSFRTLTKLKKPTHKRVLYAGISQPSDV
ncbi:hypothetical protein F5Y03DRAFT_348961 [Xylaria venustula]|nr:hypothetical protein F5Y03DRAFT_348961 [Xylaria venustula]